MGIDPAHECITADGLRRHVELLASDELEGRAPGTRGEELTVRYLVDELRALGLEPGNPDGSYVQEVPLAGYRSQPSASVDAGGRRFELRYPDDYVAVSRRLVPEVRVDGSETLFVGYGVVAPEYGWDDFKSVDVRGKTLVMLAGDPSRPDPADPSRLDERFFGGRAMTYYGRWTYKYEVAAERRAAAALIVHETGPAGYPYDVVVRSWAREGFELADAAESAGRAPVEGWLRLETARELLAAAGLDFDALKRAAGSADFSPVALRAKASFSVESTLREISSRNVVARLPGSDPSLAGEHVVFTAHWDHLGRDASLDGHQVFNGAVDNATGVAALVEIARAFARLAVAPRRSILFVSTTAEESGLLGARYYATHPLYPLRGAVANVNMDMLNPWGRTRDLPVVGLGSSTLDEVAAEVAALQGRTITPDPEPEKGLFFRSDHYELVRRGVPALFTKVGLDFVGRPPEFGRAKRADYTARHYHKVTDVIGADWDLSGMVEDARLLFEVGRRVADADSRPEWKSSAHRGSPPAESHGVQ